jgi:hypothetical protein
MRLRYPMPLLIDPREFVTSVPFLGGYIEDNDCAINRWGNVIDPTTKALRIGAPTNQPTLAYEAETRRAALTFDGSNDVMTDVGNVYSWVAGEKYYVRMVMRLNAWNATGRRIYSTPSFALQLAAASPNIQQSMGGPTANDLAMPIGAFKRVDMFYTGISADSFLRAGSAIATGGVTTITTSNTSFSLGSLNGVSASSISISNLWITRGRPSDRELASWDASDAQRYGAGVLA